MENFKAFDHLRVQCDFFKESVSDLVMPDYTKDAHLLDSLD